MWLVTLLAVFLLKPTLLSCRGHRITCANPSYSDWAVPLREGWQSDMYKWRPLQVYVIYNNIAYGAAGLLGVYNSSKELFQVSPPQDVDGPPLRVSGVGMVTGINLGGFLLTPMVAERFCGYFKSYLRGNREASLADLLVYVYDIRELPGRQIDPEPEYLRPYWFDTKSTVQYKPGGWKPTEGYSWDWTGTSAITRSTCAAM
ncbi:uncharacterized protein LOC135369999 isoform X2 [Ornithodoros turicata]|uniref:uncharacterized protein LOC135369999 isoform X2 n=1 Tax=Ornithodoros turicata TaxID=34597 RepID=UPI00313993FF